MEFYICFTISNDLMHKCSRLNHHLIKPESELVEYSICFKTCSGPWSNRWRIPKIKLVTYSSYFGKCRGSRKTFHVQNDKIKIELAIFFYLFYYIQRTRKETATIDRIDKMTGGGIGEMLSLRWIWMLAEINSDV